MIKSEQIELLTKALIAFQKEMKSVVFDADNPFFKSKYATLTNIVDSSKALLAKNGLAVTQLTTNDGGVTTILLHESGQYIGDTLTLRPAKDDPQGHGSAITYARRYAYASILGIVSDSDDDGNAASSAKPAVSHPQSKSKAPDGPTMRDMVLTKAKTAFKSPDEFKAWRIDNGFNEDLAKCNEVQLASMLVQIK